jgi:hypothetical protein
VATVALGQSSIVSSSNVATYSLAAVTQTASNLYMYVIHLTGQADTDWAVTDDQGGTYTKILRATRVAGGSILEFWVANALAVAVSTTVTYSHASGNASGCMFRSLRVSGMTRTGADAVVGSGTNFGIQSNQAAGGTPAPALPVAATTTNPTIGAVANALNPAAFTEPTGWTERHDTGINTPTSGIEVVSRDSGFTGTTVTWGSADGGAAQWCSFIAELDTSAAAAGGPDIPYIGGGYFGGDVYN